MRIGTIVTMGRDLQAPRIARPRQAKGWPVRAAMPARKAPRTEPAAACSLPDQRRHSRRPRIAAAGRPFSTCAPGQRLRCPHVGLHRRRHPSGLPSLLANEQRHRSCWQVAGIAIRKRIPRCKMSVIEPWKAPSRGHGASRPCPAAASRAGAPPRIRASPPRPGRGPGRSARRPRPA